MDRLEKFIRENRESFDRDKPSDVVWDRIEKKIIVPDQKEAPVRIISMRWISAVAASVVIAIVAWNAFVSNDYQGVASIQMDPVIEAIDPSYAQQAQSVNLQIQEKQAELRELVKDSPHLSDNLLESLEHLNTTYDALRLNLEENVNQEVLLKAMIENLNLQLTILSQQLNLIQQIKNENSYEINI